MTWRSRAAGSARLLASLAVLASPSIPLHAQTSHVPSSEPVGPPPSIPAPASGAKVAPPPLTVHQTGGDPGRATFTVEGFQIATGERTARAARLDIDGTPLSQADLSALFDPRSDEPVAARLKRLSADHIRIPELTIEEPDTRRQVYRDVLLDDLKDGRASRLSVAGGAFLDRSGASQAAFGAAETRDLDLGLILDLGAASGSHGRETIFSSLSIEAIATNDGADGAVVIGSIRVGEVRARAPAGGYAETIAAAKEASGDDLDAKRSRASAVLRLIQSVDIGSAEIRDIQTKSGDGDLRIGMLGYDLDAEGHDRFRMGDFSSGNGDGRFSVGEAVASGFDVKATAGLLIERAFGGVSAAPVGRPWTLHLGRLAFQSQAQGEASVARGEPDVSIEAVDLTGSSTGDRSTGTLTLSNMRAPVRPDGPAQALADLGYDHLGGSLSLTSSYDAARRELNFDQLSLLSSDLGSIHGSASLGSVGQEAFSTDRQAAIDALAKANINGITLSVKDEGLSRKILAMLAQREGQSEADLRQSYARQAALLAGLLLGGSTDAVQLGSALSRFIADPGRLTIKATPRDPHLPAAVLLSIATASPDGALRAFKIEATKD